MKPPWRFAHSVMNTAAQYGRRTVAAGRRARARGSAIQTTNSSSPGCGGRRHQMGG